MAQEMPPETRYRREGRGEDRSDGNTREKR